MKHIIYSRKYFFKKKKSNYILILSCLLLQISCINEAHENNCFFEKVLFYSQLDSIECNCFKLLDKDVLKPEELFDDILLTTQINVEAICRNTLLLKLEKSVSWKKGIIKKETLEMLQTYHKNLLKGINNDYFYYFFSTTKSKISDYYTSYILLIYNEDKNEFYYFHFQL